MNVWTLPGPARFLRRVERSLRDGVSVVVRFPGRQLPGFREQALMALNQSWYCAVFRPEPAIPPVESLRERFAPQLSTAWDPSLLDLCKHKEFQGRLIWLDGLDGMVSDDWAAWKQFLGRYAQASRSMRGFERTLFVAVLEGAPPVEPPELDVTLTLHDWSGVVDEMDLLFLAYERLGDRNVVRTMRSLLATTVARVAAWDVETAERLLNEEKEVILNPRSMLRSFAREKSWTPDTPVRWDLGTASKDGSSHAALASLDEPPREIRRRIWAAQLSVLLPAIDRRRIEIIEEHYEQLAVRLKLEGSETDDPLDLDVGKLTHLINRPGFDDAIYRQISEMNSWRNDLAHLKPLDARALRSLTAACVA